MRGEHYRTGRYSSRTIYRDDQLIGVMDTPADAQLVVEALNTRDRLWALKHPHTLPEQGRGDLSKVPPADDERPAGYP